MSRVSNVAPPQSYKAIEEKADSLRELLRHFGVSGDKPFPIMHVLENVMPTLWAGYYFDVRTHEELGDIGALKTPDDAIWVREDVYSAAYANQGRARFTLAHELGHLVLHPKPVLARLSAPPGMQLKVFYDPEWQADAFAAALLMPRQGIIGLTATEIADKYWVSKSAAEVRLDKIKKYR